MLQREQSRGAKRQTLSTQSYTLLNRKPAAKLLFLLLAQLSAEALLQAKRMQAFWFKTLRLSLSEVEH